MRQALDHDEVGLVVAADPHTVYALVSDVTRTPQFIPYLRECTWLDGATGPAVGARFKAVNSVGRDRHGATHRLSQWSIRVENSPSNAPRCSPARSNGGIASHPRKGAPG